jgi:hypothetical protein
VPLPRSPKQWHEDDWDERKEVSTEYTLSDRRLSQRADNQQSAEKEGDPVDPEVSI